MTLLFFGVFVRTFYASLPAAVPIFASLYYTKLCQTEEGRLPHVVLHVEYPYACPFRDFGPAIDFWA
jgi:hypothetical protein